ncbi:hypothetical protein [Streptomyces sp. NPDC050121]|uniref:hypothetical protein n=1 Tax=Streptomyces sp. NPDC050121 TaxID=3365601 RepID=UPI0037920656
MTVPPVRPAGFGPTPSPRSPPWSRSARFRLPGGCGSSCPPNRPSTVPHGAVGCLDTVKLRAATDRLRTTGATQVTVDDDTVRAELPAGALGTAVLSAPRIAGWRCAVDDDIAVFVGE